MEDLFHEWSVTGRSRGRMDVVETFLTPPSSYRKCGWNSRPWDGAIAVDAEQLTGLSVAEQ